MTHDEALPAASAVPHEVVLEHGVRVPGPLTFWYEIDDLLDLATTAPVPQYVPKRYAQIHGPRGYAG